MSDQHESHCQSGNSQSVTLVRRHHESEKLAFTPNEGYTAARIMEMLNESQAKVFGMNILASVDPASPDADWVPIATVAAAENDRRDDTWEIDESCACCRPLTSAEWDRGAAERLADYAEHYGVEGDFDFAKRCIAFAKLLLDRGGSWENSAAIKLLTAQAWVLDQTGRKAKALPQLLRAAEIAKQICEPTDAWLPTTACNLGEVLLHVGRPAEAEPVLAAALNWLEVHVPPADAQPDYLEWLAQNTTNARTMLAEARSKVSTAKTTLRTRRKG